MKRILVILSLCLIFQPAGILRAEKPSANPRYMPMESVLHTASHSLDSLLMNTLASLELTAMTPEAKSGEWKGVKPYLAKLEQRLAGVYFFVRPDGNYFSVDKDYTNLNISNRSYFKALFAGNQVRGDSIYSRSTGRKSAVMASPIAVDGKVVGALGASVYLDDLHLRLNREMALPEGYTWFVVNAEGQTMLDRDADFIFMNALTQGSASLKDGIAKALKTHEGRMQYELGGVVRHAVYQKLQSLDWWMILARIEGGEVLPPAKLELSLAQFVPQLQGALNRIDVTLSRTLGKKRGGMKNEADIRKVLADVINEEPAVITASYIDPKGTLRYIEPGEYKNVEGSDISSQEHVIGMTKKPGPIFSAGFRAVEGFEAVVIAHPVSGAEKGYQGSINLILRPEFIVQPLLKNLHVPPEYELWIMQTDGRIIYDPDSDEMGRMLFSDPLYADYESLKKLGKKIAANPSGVGEYIFQAPGGKEKVIKVASWDTVRLHNRDWRVVLTSRPYEKKSSN
jgi:hypothetical protein